MLGHIGLTPQTSKNFSVRGRSNSEGKKILKDALEVSNSGAFGLIVECVIESLAKALIDESTEVQELKDKLSDDFVKQFQNQTDQKLMNDSIEYLIDSTKIKLPSEFLVKWMQLSSEKKISQNEAQTEYEKSEKGMKYQLIESKIIIDNKLQVNFEDLKSFTSELIKNQMLQYGQPIPEEKELDGIVARVMSNKDEIKRLTEQLTSNRILEFFKENFNYKLKKVSYDEYVKEVYPS